MENVRNASFQSTTVDMDWKKFRTKAALFVINVFTFLPIIIFFFLTVVQLKPPLVLIIAMNSMFIIQMILRKISKKMPKEGDEDYPSLLASYAGLVLSLLCLVFYVWP